MKRDYAKRMDDDVTFDYNDGNFCVDGLVYSSRTPHTGLLKYKNAIHPVTAEAIDLAKNRIKIKILRYFTTLDDINMVWSLEKNDKETFFTVDYKQNGVGSHSCGPKLMEKY